MAALLALLVAVGVAGVVLLVVGLVPDRHTPAVPARPTRVPLTRLRMRWSRRQRVLAVTGFAAGCLLWVLTGWVVFLIGLPIAVLTLPMLFTGDRAKERIERLDALEGWTRGLAGLTVAGAGLEQTITASLQSAPAAVRPQIASLVARINARWRTEDALRAFAADVGDATCDLIVMHLLLTERMRGPGLARALEDLADSISDEVRARRAIEADRAKPQQNMRIITITTLVLLCAIPFAGTFMAPYATPTGQLLLVAWIACYAGILVWLRRISAPSPSTRMLPDQVEA